MTRERAAAAEYRVIIGKTFNAICISFVGMERDLDGFSRSASCENPKLQRLQERILSYAESENAQGIVFCKTREMSLALMKWMKDTPSLAVLKPHNIIGSSSRTTKYGQSVNCKQVTSIG